MKKTVLCTVLFLVCATSLHAATEDGRTAHGPWVRFGIVESRGFLNFVGMPVEVFRTAAVEVKDHHWLWPVSLPGRLISNLFIRMASVFNDVLFYPPVVFFSDDISPWTEPFGLPEYPWQKG